VNIPSSIWTLLIGIVLTLVSLWYGQNHIYYQRQPQTKRFSRRSVQQYDDRISGLFLLVQGILIYSAFKFRRRLGDDSDGPPVFGNIPLVLWTAIRQLLSWDLCL